MKLLLFILFPFFCSAQVNVVDFGADPSGVHSSSDAFDAAINSSPAFKTTWSIPSLGHGIVNIPPGQYKLDRPIYINTTISLIGGSNSYFPYQEVQLQFSGTAGIIIRSTNAGYGARSVTLQNLYLRNFGSSLDSSQDGINTNTRCVFDNCAVDDFGGNGFSFITNDSGNCNNSIMTNCTAYYNAKNGLFMSGNESNNFGIYSCNFSANGMCGVCDNSFLGNMYFNCHVSSNGLRAATGYSKSWCVYNGKVYQAIKYPNQKGIQPTVTSGWQNYWIENSTVFASTFPSAWNADSTYWYTGAYAVPSASATSCYQSCYSEGGEGANNMNQFSWCIGGDHGAIFANKDNIYINPSASQLLFHGAGIKIYDKDSTKTFIGFHNTFGLQLGSEKAGYSDFQLKAFEASRTAILFTDNSTGNQAFSVIGKGYDPVKLGLVTLPRTGMVVFPYDRGYTEGDVNNGNIAATFLQSKTGPPTTGTYAAGTWCWYTGIDTTIVGWKCILRGPPSQWVKIKSAN